MCALWNAVSSTAHAFGLRATTPTTDLIVVLSLLLLIGEIQQSFSLRWPLYHTFSGKLNVPVIISFFVDAVEW